MPILKQPSVFSRFKALRTIKRWLFARRIQAKADRPVLEAIARLRPGETAMDVGANVGNMTAAMLARVGKQGIVIAIEPVPDCVHRIRHRFRLAHNVIVLELCATGQEHGTHGCLYVTKMSSHSSLTRSRIETAVRTRVRLIALDELQVDKLDLLKIDAEGHDLQILKGACNTIVRCRPHTIIAECRPGCEDREQMRALLDCYGYFMHETQFDIVAIRRQHTA